MELAVEQMEAQLRLWGRQIGRLAANIQSTGRRARFDALLHIDELKALLAIAETTLVELKAVAATAAVGDTKHARLRSDMKVAWDELAAAFNNPNPSP